ncbi:MAG TPA: hypothetical protein DCX53_12180, partial [Anaerolineae bacterium]|nr:hypothetical protein [Anaerolineae bacterium]
ESQLDVTSEVSVDETDDDGAQLESVEEIVVEDKQSTTIVEPSLGNIPDASNQPLESGSTLGVGTDYDAAAAMVSTPALLHSEETIADPSAGNDPVILVIDNLSDLINQIDLSENTDDNIQDFEPNSRLDGHDDLVDDEVVDTDIHLEPSNGDEDIKELVSQIVAGADADVEKTDTEDISLSEPRLEFDEPASEDESTHTFVDEPAYDAFLTQAIDPVLEDQEKFSPPVELKADPDTKNAHVWNELGNVYFNTGAFEEAVTAYSKAIELDDWFAWPYSNLALVYVQKEKYTEAILLYQRSIELFSSDKDKAITWNRLGNVYRRLNDYDNAIACYQRADELDPNNATRSLRSRFSLLGSLSLEETPSVAAYSEAQ